MKKRIKLTNNRVQSVIEKTVESAVNRAFTEGFKSILHDITYRIDSLMNMGLLQAGLPHRVTSEMLHLSRPMLDGFTITDNSPSAGSIAWADCNIMYKGTKYTITNGNTSSKYVYWTLATTPTTFKTSATKPTLTDDDILICVNNDGVHQLVIGEGRMVDGSTLLDGTIGSGEIGSGAVTTAKIASAAITNGLLATDAVEAGNIASGAVTETKIGSGAVTTAKIGSSAVGSTQLASNAVTDTKIASSAVTETKIATSAVTSGKLASGAVTSAALASGAVTTTAVATGAIGSTQLADGAVIGAKIGAGQVATDKLSIASHLLF